ncbi:hypothetical protein [Chitinophaga flava]|uniref:Uncharacterized protein n=1 Tax=Chitinophaga flava TaxID=2259036 RepID=A0A365XUQ8_9BACT|nr:hypothetical protein [Chitinophaga flava]RBL89761.1 hypothetical protein DF182_25050 [Chitinophaga flava]
MEDNKNQQNKSGIRADYQCEFMQNYVAESTIDSGKGIESIKMGDDGAVIFFIGKNGVLTALIAANGSDSGWDAVTLSTEGFTATAFDIYHDEKTSKFILCFAETKDGQTTLRVSDEISLGEDQLKKFKGSLNYRSKKLASPERTINHITIHSKGVLFSTVLKSTDALYYHFEYKDEPQAYTLPENTKTIRQLTIGSLYGGAGVFLLYDMPDNNRTMLFQGFPEAEGEEAFEHRFETDKGKTINCFDLVADEQGNSVLYTAGDGIYRFKDTREGKEKIADVNINYTRLDVSKNNGEITVWAIGKGTGEACLYYLTNNYYQIDRSGNQQLTESNWTKPLPMYQNITEFSAIRGKDYVNQLFLFSDSVNNGAPSLVHFWQDAVSKNWQEMAVGVANLDNSVELNTYTTEVNFSKEVPSAQANGKISISSKENTILYINNKKHFLTIGKHIELDYINRINIICPVDSLAAPAITISAPFLDAPLHIEPAKGIAEKLTEKIKSGADLRSAKKQNGELLLKGSFDPKKLDSVASAINNIAGTAITLSGQGKENPPNAITQVTFGGTIPADAIFLTDIGNTIGDIFYSIKKGFMEITRFFIEKVAQGVQFIIEVGGKVIRWIANAAKDAIIFLEKVWEKVKVFFKDLVEFLAFLFDWNDIKETKEALKMAITKGLKSISPGLKELEAMALDKIRGFKKNLEQVLGFDDPSLNKNFSEMANSPAPYEGKRLDSRMNWMDSKKDVVFGNTGVQSDGVDVNKLSNVKDTSHDPDLKTVLDLIIDLFKGKLLLGEFIKKMAKVIINLTFKAIEAIVKELFKLIIDSVDFIVNALEAEINVPLLSDIYKKISGSSLSIVDFISLIIAIPMTIGYKLANNSAPFKDITAEQFSNNIVASLA